MVKHILFITFTTIILFAQENSLSLQRECLSCHQLHSVPSQMIYRRYLMKYSSKKRVKEKIFAYLQNPSKENSIMPAQFFLKFMMKEKSHLSDKQMNQLIDAYIEHYDISKKLFNPHYAVGLQ